MSKTTLVIIIYILGLIFGALVLDIWDANTNIFKINEDKVLKQLAKFNFIEDIYVKKIIPSSININLSKTSILGKTFVNGEEFYIGKNGKLINSNQIFENNNYA